MIPSWYLLPSPGCSIAIFSVLLSHENVLHVLNLSCAKVFEMWEKREEGLINQRPWTLRAASLASAQTIQIQAANLVHSFFPPLNLHPKYLYWYSGMSC